MNAAANSNSRAGSSVRTSDWSMAMIRFWLAPAAAAAAGAGAVVGVAAGATVAAGAATEVGALAGGAGAAHATLASSTMARQKEAGPRIMALPLCERQIAIGFALTQNPVPKHRGG